MISYGLREVALYACFAGMNLVSEMEVMIMTKKIAHLWWSNDHGVSVVRMTNPIVNGRFTGHGWYDMPCETVLSPQEYADEVREVVFYTDSYGNRGYAYPKEACEKGGERWR